MTRKRAGLVRPHSRSMLVAVAVAVVAICLLPVLGVAIAAFTGGTDTLSFLASTVLGRYIHTTFLLVVLVASGTFLIGTTTAWLVTNAEFRGRRVLEIALILPLAFPAYVLAFAYTHFLDHPGIVQSSLRDLTGWGPRDYWFPEIRSTGGAAAMLILVLYPYVYLMARAAFLQQSAATYFTARTLGKSPMGAFFSVSMPMARPAIAAGVLLATMETIADFGTVAYFGVQTFATGIYTSWFTLADRAAAAQLALGLMAMALLLAGIEAHNRGDARFHATERRQEGMARIPLRGLRGTIAGLICFAPVLFGCLIPTIGLIWLGSDSEQSIFSARYLNFAKNSITLAAIAAIVTVLAAIMIGFFKHTHERRLSSLAVNVGRMGYAIPGGVIAVGLMVPFGAFDNALDAFMRSNFGVSTGLLFTGTITLLIMAYMIRFLAAALGAYESGQSAINPNLDAAARNLGKTAAGALRHVYLPIMKPSILTALLIVFVDVMKELPATLIMRPFNFDTLAVQAFRLASDERLEGAAVPSLVIVAVGLGPVILLCVQAVRQHRR